MLTLLRPRCLPQHSLSLLAVGARVETCVHTIHGASYHASARACSSNSGYIYTKGAGVFGALGHGDSLQDVPAFKQVHVHAGAGTDVEPAASSHGSHQQHPVGMPRQSSSGGEGEGGGGKRWHPLTFRQISAGWGHTAAVSACSALQRVHCGLCSV
jgi:alpha-tubulin suppressor-like RCC1 family protein